MLRKAMVSSGAKDFLVDGFPRALDQAESFEQQIKPCELVRVSIPHKLLQAGVGLKPS